jgi:hypothetical protein
VSRYSICSDHHPASTAGNQRRSEVRVRAATVETALRATRKVIPEDGSDDPGMMGVPEAITWFSAEGGKTHGRWQNRALLPADPGPMPFNPAVAVPYLKGPALFLVAAQDRLAAAAAIAVSKLAPDGSERERAGLRPRSTANATNGVRKGN